MAKRKVRARRAVRGKKLNLSTFTFTNLRDRRERIRVSVWFLDVGATVEEDLPGLAGKLYHF